MKENYKNSLAGFKEIEPPAGLLGKVILAIKREEQLKKTRKLFFSFLLLLIFSLITVPYSWIFFVNQVKTSGILYFISTGINNLEIFFNFWQDFVFIIFESLPILGLITFLLSLGLCLFTLRLFLHKKGLLIKYLFHRI